MRPEKSLALNCLLLPLIYINKFDIIPEKLEAVVVGELFPFRGNLIKKPFLLPVWTRASAKNEQVMAIWQTAELKTPKLLGNLGGINVDPQLDLNSNFELWIFVANRKQTIHSSIFRKILTLRSLYSSLWYTRSVQTFQCVLRGYFPSPFRRITICWRQEDANTLSCKSIMKDC